MNKKEREAFKHFISAYKHQWDLNSYYREQYDDDLEYYKGYRPKNRYPLAYNVVYNKLLPRSHNILARFMDQLYQAGTGDLISVRPRKKSDVDRAPRVRGLLNHQLETLNDIDMQGGSYLFNFQWMFNAVNWGKGIAKLYWRKEERITPKRINVPMPKFNPSGKLEGFENKMLLIEMPQVVYDGPYAEVIHNKLFVPHPHYKNIQKMPFVFCVYAKSLDYIKKKADEGVFIKKNIKDLGWSGTESKSGSGTGEDTGEGIAKSLEIEGALTTKELESDRSTRDIDIIEGYGKYIFPEDETPYEVGSGVKIKGKESEAIVHIGNYKTLLSLKKNTYVYRPFFDIGCYYNPELYWDIGLIKLGKGIQEQYDTLANTRFQNAIMLVNQMLKVRVDADIPQDSLIWKPYGIIPVEEMDDVQPLITPDVSQSGAFREQEEFFDKILQEMTGVYAYNMGATPPRQEHVGTITSLQSMGEARTKLLLMTMDHTGFRPFLKYMMLLNMYHLPSNAEARINTAEGDQFKPLFAGDIHVDYDFSARYTGMEPALGKQFKAQQLLQYSQMWQESPYLQHHQFMKAVMELMDFHDTEKYIKSPEQVKQEQAQAQQQAMKTQMMGLAMQAQTQGKQQEQKMIGDIAKQILK